MNFPAYSPPSNMHVSPSRVSSPPVRSSSMREFHMIRGEVAEGSSIGGSGPRPSTTHRSVSMSTQNLTDHQRRDNQTYYPTHHHHVANKPRRSQSFNEKSMSSGGGSLAQSGLSSSSTSSTGSGSSSNTVEYPSKTSSHSHSHGGYRTYPLRETSSLQTLPSSASYGGNTAKTGHGTDGYPHQNKHGSHHGGHHGQIRSSSVRNIPSASGYNITMTTTTSAVSTTSSSAGQSGRPIFSQPISATAGRVESVDIPTQLPNTTMATNVRDLSSSYPGHHNRASGSSSRATSGQIHGGVKGENPKPSRRHLHKVHTNGNLSPCFCSENNLLPSCSS